MFTRILHKSPDGVRHEQKYMMNRRIYEILKRRVRAVMNPDPNAAESGGYRVTSLYFDDVYRTAYKDKTLGLLKRRKFRIRVYNLSPERIMFEGKYKEGAYIKKKSAFLTLDEYYAILKGDYSFCRQEFSENSELSKISEISENPENKRQLLADFCACAKAHGLRPAVITDYYREAFTCRAGNVRVTFDRDISAGLSSDNSFDLFKARYTPAYDMPDDVVLEIKFDRFLPSYVGELFTGFPLMQNSVSKYVLCANRVLAINKIF